MRLIIYTGKGGTGKTVTSSSTAIALAENNHHTLLISSDPAHTLGDAFMMPDIGYEPRQVIPNLEVLQVDPVVEMNKQYSTIYLTQFPYSLQKGSMKLLHMKSQCCLE